MRFETNKAIQLPKATSWSKVTRGGAEIDATKIMNHRPSSATKSIWLNSIIEIFKPPHTKRRVILALFLGLLFFTLCILSLLYNFHHGFRRTVQFWTKVGPMILEHRYVKYKSMYWDKCDDKEFRRRLAQYHERTAPKAVHLIINMGGIYVKLGQLLSTLGSGILEETYVQALRPLQDGLPPRDYEEIASIIEQSTGRRMDDIFSSFEERPIGSASIAQAHRATLKSAAGTDNQQVIVKVQYPEVAELFEADLNNLELITRILMPDNLDLIKAARKRHEKELDFRIEAQNLRECTANMQAHQMEPQVVRIPRVRNETGICNKHVLVMEYLQGISLADAIHEEQTRIARALGQGSAEELRSTLAKRMREHFERGGGEGNGSVELMGVKRAKFLQQMGPLAAGAIRTYARWKEKVGDVLVGVHNVAATGVSAVSAGLVRPQLKKGSNELRYVGVDVEQGPKKVKITSHVNLAKVLKTLIHVHGLQMLKDGVYNADPHPGNVLVLPDGKLGLLDYGMVGRLSNDQRETIAQTVLALANKNIKEAAQLYRGTGYRVAWRDGEITDDAILHRFATFHLDKIDFTPITLENGEKHDVIEILQSVQERKVPDWIEQARRLGGLLMGVASQAARPIALSKEWENIAKKALHLST